jgi:hypothetical protein
LNAFHCKSQAQRNLYVGRVAVAMGCAYKQLGYLLPRVFSSILGGQMLFHEPAGICECGDRHNLWDDDRAG